MAFWDNLGQKASETTAKAVQKAKDLSDIAKLNSTISEEENKIYNNYLQIGKLYAAMHPQDGEEDFRAMIDAINESNQQIQECRQKIQDIKKIVKCPQCGAEVPVGVAFCSACGMAMPKAQPVNLDDMVRCNGCGSMVKKGARFCTVCGRQMVQQATPNVAYTDVPATKQCPKCGSVVDASLSFCTECGQML